MPASGLAKVSALAFFVSLTAPRLDLLPFVTKLDSLGPLMEIYCGAAELKEFIRRTVYRDLQQRI